MADPIYDNLEDITDGTTRLAMTPAERTKIAAAATSDTVDEAVSNALENVPGFGYVDQSVSAEADARQAADDLKEDAAKKGTANGYAGLDSSAKVPLSQLPASLFGDVKYVSAWNASTNTPAIPTASAGNVGNYYVVSVAGATSIGGVTDWKLGDWLISNGSTWDKIDNTDSIISVSGLTGAISQASLREALGLGTAAYATLGSLAGQIPVRGINGRVNLADIASVAEQLQNGDGSRQLQWTGTDEEGYFAVSGDRVVTLDFLSGASVQYADATGYADTANYANQAGYADSTELAAKSRMLANLENSSFVQWNAADGDVPGYWGLDANRIITYDLGNVPHGFFRLNADGDAEGNWLLSTGTDDSLSTYVGRAGEFTFSTDKGWARVHDGVYDEDDELISGTPGGWLLGQSIDTVITVDMIDGTRTIPAPSNADLTIYRVVDTATSNHSWQVATPPATKLGQRIIICIEKGSHTTAFSITTGGDTPYTPLVFPGRNADASAYFGSSNAMTYGLVVLDMTAIADYQNPGFMRWWVNSTTLTAAEIAAWSDNS